MRIDIETPDAVHLFQGANGGAWVAMRSRAWARVGQNNP